MHYAPWLGSFWAADFAQPHMNASHMFTANARGWIIEMDMQHCFRCRGLGLASPGQLPAVLADVFHIIAAHFLMISAISAAWEYEQDQPPAGILACCGPSGRPRSAYLQPLN